MVDGKLVKALLLALLFVAPMAAAGAPKAGFTSAYSLGGQRLSDFAVDPATGNYGIAVVEFDSVKLPITPHNDVYLCDFAGIGCRGYNHADASGSNGAKQVTDVTAFQTPSGITPRYAVGGPGNYVSLWTNTLSRAQWTKTVSAESQSTVTAVAIEPNEASYVVAASSSGLSTAGSVVVFESDGRVRWSYTARDADGGTAVRPTALDYARTSGLVAVGTTEGVFFLTPSGTAPTTETATNTMDLGAQVREVAFSRTANALVVATSNGVDLIPISGGKPVMPHWNRNLQGGATAVAISGNGDVFAAASGTKIYFYQRVNTSFIAEGPIGEYDAGVAVTDLAYDGTGSLLVATAGSRVIGFGAGRTMPIWNFDATTSAGGGLDGPLQRVALTDDAQRFSVAGATRVTTYRTSASVDVVAIGGATRVVSPGSTSTVEFEITNTGSLSDDYTFVVTRPVGWGGQNGEGGLVHPDGTLRFNVTLEAPPGIPPATEGLRVDVRSRVCVNTPSVCPATPQGAQPGTIYSAGVNLTVPRTVALQVDYREERLVMQPSEEQTLRFRVLNIGNAEGVVNLSAQQQVSRGASWPLTFPQPQVRVGPNSEVEVTATLNAPADAASGDRNLITFIAREGTSVIASDNVTVFINPEFAVDVFTGSVALEFKPAETRVFTVNVTNRGNTDDVYNVTANVTPESLVSDWNVRMDGEQLRIPRGQTRTVAITLRAAVAEPREDAVLVVKAISVGSGETVTDSASIALIPKPAEQEEDKGLPAPSLLAGLLALALVALGRRRGRT